MPENMLLELSQWAMSSMDDNYLCGFGVFSNRWLALSFTVCELSMRGRILEELARDSEEALVGLGMAGVDIPACALLGDSLRFWNKEDSDERYPRFFCCWWDMIMMGCGQGELSLIGPTNNFFSRTNFDSFSSLPLHTIRVRLDNWRKSFVFILATPELTWQREFYPNVHRMKQREW